MGSIQGEISVTPAGRGRATETPFQMVSGGERDCLRERERIVCMRARQRFAPTLSPVRTRVWGVIGERVAGAEGTG